MNHSVGMLGIFAFIGVAWLLSENRARFPWRTVLTGLGLQTILAWLILRTRAGEFFLSALTRCSGG